MVFAITTAVITMGCQGCATVSPHEQVREEPAAPPSLGVQMAAPSAFGSGVLQAPAPEPSVHVFNSTATRFSGVPIDTSSVAVGSLLVGQPADYNVPGPQFSVPDNTRLDWTGGSPLVAVAAERGRAGLLRPRTVEKNIAAEIAISAPKEVTGLTFDVGVAPRIAVREEGEILTRRVGGEVRIGQNFDLMAKGSGQPKGWYIFAGADGEALVWDADESGFRPSLGDMALTDQVTVGDMQAGFAVQRAGGELSLSYIRREMKYSDRNVSISETEDFAGVSFTMRR
ncbi:hypothetical protein HY29_03240 [Hyphomonas beringensis]|uniref:DUF2219 domain-containing protein n=1 Tax=Hyphomonas beringensis TaxID=1280946 RepID=A0A062U1C1_9PROT|nr:lipid A-modifier LpxR family protein [Hyphomonas beringensis]KCZ54101.1 hypothetical protein HY29_03240 [Hyphomonas beringensis]